ncbi:HPr family phosphocarrier protein [Kaarinaea lacus]
MNNNQKIMVSKQITIINKLGLHARAAAKFVSLASSFSSNIQVAKDGKTVNGKSIMGVMMLAASQNSQITVSAEGDDEKLALEKIQHLIADRFGEEE